MFLVFFMLLLFLRKNNDKYKEYRLTCSCFFSMLLLFENMTMHTRNYSENAKTRTDNQT